MFINENKLPYPFYPLWFQAVKPFRDHMIVLKVMSIGFPETRLIESNTPGYFLFSYKTL
jgi:hypothetical protein